MSSRDFSIILELKWVIKFSKRLYKSPEGPDNVETKMRKTYVITIQKIVNFISTPGLRINLSEVSLGKIFEKVFLSILLLLFKLHFELFPYEFIHNKALRNNIFYKYNCDSNIASHSLFIELQILYFKHFRINL